jgi:hypothetical protein
MYLTAYWSPNSCIQNSRSVQSQHLLTHSFHKKFSITILIKNDNNDNWIHFLRVSNIIIAVYSTFYFLIETVIKMFWVKKREQFLISTAPNL